MRRILVVTVLLLAAPACGADDGGDAAPGRVEMTSSQSFDPKSTTIAVGETVTWDNTSTEQHTVTAFEDSLPDDAGYFASGGASSEDAANDDLSEGLVGPGESYAHTFEAPGTYRYYCIPHESAGMVGTIVVTE
ncbi:MAG TPA: plastocyanin/azurin family copper-binding protein [Actinomycetota bacterium]|jgi:plastocyanin